MILVVDPAMLLSRTQGAEQLAVISGAAGETASR